MISRSTLALLVALFSLLFVSAPAPAVRMPSTLYNEDADASEGDPGDGVLDPAADRGDAGMVHPQHDDAGTRPWPTHLAPHLMLVPERASPGSPWPIVFRLVSRATVPQGYAARRPLSAAPDREGRWHHAP